MSWYKNAISLRVGQESVSVVGAEQPSVGPGWGTLAALTLGAFGVVWAVAGKGSEKRTAYDNHPAFRRGK